MEYDDYGDWETTFIEGVLVAITIIAFSGII